MTKYELSLLAAVLCVPMAAQSQSADTCVALAGLKIDAVEITKAALVPAGTTVPPPYTGAPGIGPLPAHCRVDGVINRRRASTGRIRHRLCSCTSRQCSLSEEEQVRVPREIDESVRQSLNRGLAEKWG